MRRTKVVADAVELLEWRWNDAEKFPIRKRTSKRNRYAQCTLESMVSHSHIPINHLLKQLEETCNTTRGNRDVRPEWVARLIEQTAELFEPLTGVGRVGFQCQLAEDCWVVGLYLGATEIVGGRDDGKSKYVNFEVDLQKLKAQFDRIDEFYWSVFPSPTDEAAAQARSFITLAGTVGGNPLRLQIFSIPPDDAGPGLKQYPNGQFEPY